MEISRIYNSRNNKSRINKEIKVDDKGTFSQSFNQAKEEKNKENIIKLLDDIKRSGNKLIVTKSYIDVIKYKRLIKEYLESVLPYIYNTKKDISFWQTQYFIIIDKIDKKLEEITDNILEEEKSILDVAKTVDEIQGLIVDVYK